MITQPVPVRCIKFAKSFLGIRPLATMPPVGNVAVNNRPPEGITVFVFQCVNCINLLKVTFAGYRVIWRRCSLCPKMPVRRNGIIFFWMNNTPPGIIFFIFRVIPVFTFRITIKLCFKEFSSPVNLTAMYFTDRRISAPGFWRSNGTIHRRGYRRVREDLLSQLFFHISQCFECFFRTVC
ncbi:hypothetical protein SRABI106_02631 [Rahnella aquatilis]|nr:hypothetical protein SRABI106_02631 [Rahnella aquatilis]